MDRPPAIFSDRDGTLIDEVNFLSDPELVAIAGGTISAVEALKSAGYKLIVITNQSGIGRGIFAEDDMHRVNDRVQEMLGGAIDGFYFCPHLPDEGCSCRKPGLELIERAVADHSIDLSRSWFIGDKAIDVSTGQAASMRTALVATGYGAGDRSKLELPADIFAADFAEAINRILTPA